MFCLLHTFWLQLPLCKILTSATNAPDSSFTSDLKKKKKEKKHTIKKHKFNYKDPTTVPRLNLTMD